MKTKLLLSGLLAVLLLGGCQSGDAVKDTVKNTANQTPTASSGAGNKSESVYEEELRDAVSQNTLQEESVKTTKIKKKKADGWYMRTVVELTADDGTVYRHSTAGVFGELEDSKEGKDKHDIPSFGTSSVQVVFPQTEWEDDNGNYFSNYHQYRAGNRRSWLFEVRNDGNIDLSDANLTIIIKGPFKVYKKRNDIGYDKVWDESQRKRKRLKLVDVDNHKIYRFKNRNKVTLKMEGKKVRTFRWVLDSVYQADFDDVVRLSSPAPSLSATALEQNKLQQKKGKFGLPPAP